MVDTATASAPNNPFPGPVALSADYPVFGRNEQINNLHSQLLVDQVVVLHGVSGAGKSSLLKGHGGIRDRLTAEAGFSVAGPVDFRLPSGGVADDRFYENHLIELLNREEPEPWREENQRIIDQIDLEIFLIRCGNRLGCAHQLLIIDQFEDIFTHFPYDEAGKQRFFRMLGELLQNNPSIRLLFAMRDEYLGELDHYRKYLPGRFKSTFRLELMRKKNAEEAIELTAQHHSEGLSLCPKDVTALVHNLSQATFAESTGLTDASELPVEPLFLQLACRDAWSQVETDFCKVETATQGNDIPCVPLARGSSKQDMDQVLARFFLTTINHISHHCPGNEYKLRSFVQDGLISSKGLRNLIRQDEATGTWGLTAPQLSQMVDEHLVRRQLRNQITYYELAHDRLVAPVQKSNDEWLDQQPEWRRIARSWHQGASGKHGASLWEIIAARGVLKSKPDTLTPFERDFIRQKGRESWRIYVIYPAIWVCSMLIIGGGIIYWAKLEARSNQQAAVAASEEAQAAKEKVASATTALKDIEAAKNQLQEQTEQLERQAADSAIELRRQKENARRHEANAVRYKQETEQKEKEITEKQNKIKEKDDISAVLDTLLRHREHKDVAYQDQAAVIQVLKAHRQAKRLFPREQDRERFTNALRTAYNDALEPRPDTPGFSRTVPRLKGVAGPVALHGGRHPLMAYITDDCLDIRELGPGLRTIPCLMQFGIRPQKMLFSPDGSQLAAVSPAGIHLVDMPRPGDASADPVTLPVTGAGSVTTLAYSADGTVFAVATNEWIHLVCRGPDAWKTCGSFRHEAGRHDPVTAVAIDVDPSGLMFAATGTRRGRVRIQRMQEGPQGFTPSGTLISIAAPAKKYQRVRSSKEVLALSFRKEQQRQLIIVHKDVRVFLSSAIDADATSVTTTPIVFDLGSLAHGTRSEKGNDHFNYAAISPAELLYAILEDELQVWRLDQLPAAQPEASTPLQVPVLRYTTGARNLVNLTVGSRYVLGQGHFRTWIWEPSISVVSKLIQHEIPGPQARIPGDAPFYPQAVAFDAQGNLLSGSPTYGLQTWTIDEQANWQARAIGAECSGTDSVRALGLSTDRSMVAVAMSKKKLMVASLTEPGRVLLCDNEQHRDGLWAAVFNRDDRWLASADWDGHLLLWGVGADGALQFSKRVETGRHIRALAFHPQQDLLAVGTTDGGVHLYRITATGALVRLTALDFPNQQTIGSILDLKFSNNGEKLAAAGGSGPIQLWSIQLTGTIDAPELDYLSWRTLAGHAGETRALAFNPAKPLLASGGADEEVRIWNLNQPDRTPAILRGADADVMAIAWDASGTHMLTSYKQPQAIGRDSADPTQDHGKLLVWAWDLDEFARVACDSIWSVSKADLGCAKEK